MPAAMPGPAPTLALLVVGLCAVPVPSLSIALPPLVKTLARGSMLRISADLTGGLPLDHWKTRSVRHSNETALQAFRAIGQHQGGIKAYWAGLPAKIAEGWMCGGVLMAAKEGTQKALFKTKLPIPESVIGAIAGVSGGVCACVVLAPTTMLVMTAATTGRGTVETFTDFVKGKRPFTELYTGGGPLCLREASNWASRQGITDLVRNGLKRQGVAQGMALEIGSGVVGGVLACWNNPFEVVRIHEQRDRALAHAHGSKAVPSASEGTLDKVKGVVEKEGVKGLFVGLVPRCALSAWLTCFMVVAPRFV